MLITVSREVLDDARSKQGGVFASSIKTLMNDGYTIVCETATGPLRFRDVDEFVVWFEGSDALMIPYIASLVVSYFDTAEREKMKGMIKGGVDGYLARHGLYPSAEGTKRLCKAATLFCSDNNLQRESNNEDTRVRILEFLDSKCRPDSIARRY